MDRHFLKCVFCERPLSVNAENREELQAILKQNCPLCNEPALRYMGRVQKTNLVKDVVKSACDLRCTNAVGPHCDCVCSNANHGTHRLVIFNKVVGKLEVVEKDLLNGNENYLARIKRMATAKNKIKVNVIAFLNFKNKDILDLAKAQGGYWRLKWDDYAKYRTYQEALTKIDKIENLKSIQRKINTLTGMIKGIGTNLEYMQAIYETQETVNA